MKFNIRHLIWLTAFAAILCCGIGFTFDNYRKAQRVAEIARANAEVAWENAKAQVVQSSTSVWVVDELGVAKQVVHGKQIVETCAAKVIGVVDGDTIKVLKYPELKDQIKVRLESIDCPEKKQPYGNVAKQAVGDLVFDRSVTIQKTGTDRYGRTLAFVIVDGVNVSDWMIQNGFAWHYTDYSDSVELARLEQEARQAKRGLWQDADPIPPWEWRKKK